MSYVFFGIWNSHEFAYFHMNPEVQFVMATMRLHYSSEHLRQRLKNQKQVTRKKTQSVLEILFVLGAWSILLLER